MTISLQKINAAAIIDHHGLFVVSKMQSLIVICSICPSLVTNLHGSRVLARRLRKKLSLSVHLLLLLGKCFILMHLSKLQWLLSQITPRCYSNLTPSHGGSPTAISVSTIIGSLNQNLFTLSSNWDHYPSSDIIQKLNYCADDISTWIRDIIPNYKQLINKQRAQIEEARNLIMVDGSDTHMEGMQKNLASLLLQEHSYQRQRSKIFWLTDGDTNSKFFHSSASAGKRRNLIKKKN